MFYTYETYKNDRFWGVTVETSTVEMAETEARKRLKTDVVLLVRISDGNGNRVFDIKAKPKAQYWANGRWIE